MSVTNIKTCYDIIAALAYQQTKNGRDRCAAKRSNIEPFNFNNFARMAIDAGRKVQGFTIIQAFSPEELKNTPENVELVNLIGCELAARAFSGCPYQVITHNDSKTGHIHNHISVLNYDLDTGKCINRDSRWLTLSRINDALMQDYGMEICNAQTQNTDQKAYFDRQRNPDKYIWQDDLEERVERALNHAISPGDFASRLKSEGVTAKIYGKNGKPLKHMVFIFNGNDNKVHRKRGNKMSIGNGFTYKELMETFNQNAAKAKEPIVPEGIMATAETTTPTVKTSAAEMSTATKPHPKTVKKPEDVDLSAGIYEKKKQQKTEEEKKKKLMQIQLAEVQRKKEAKEKEMDAIQEKLDTVIESIEKSDDIKKIEWLEEKERQLQRRLYDLQKECLSFGAKEKCINSDLNDRQMTLDTRLEMGYEINRAKQKQHDNRDISLG